MQFTLCRQVLFFYQALVLVESSLEQVACYVTWRCYFVQCYLLTLVFNTPHSDLVKVTIRGIKLLFGTILTVYEVLWCKLDSVGLKILTVR